jgi:protein gp37
MFHPGVEDAWLDRVLAVVATNRQHTFMVLTKRPARMHSYLLADQRPHIIQRAADSMAADQFETPEEWRAVVGFEGAYEVSSLGRVRRADECRKGRRRLDRTLAMRLVRGYSAVCLSAGGVVTQKRVNRLVLEAFVGLPPSTSAEARHRNGEPADNRLSNLSWGSKADNMADAARHGTAGVWMRGRARFSAEEIQSIRTARSQGAKLAEIAREYNTTPKHVSAICVGAKYRAADPYWPLPNLWLGVTAENQAALDSRLPVLMSTPAALHFVSAEPLIGPITMPAMRSDWPAWLIIGGESGPGARPLDLDGVRDMLERARFLDVPVFIKQLGSHWARTHGVRGKGRSHGQRMDDWPEDLRVRETPWQQDLVKLLPAGVPSAGGTDNG